MHSAGCFVVLSRASGLGTVPLPHSSPRLFLVFGLPLAAANSTLEPISRSANGAGLASRVTTLAARRRCPNERKVHR